MNLNKAKIIDTLSDMRWNRLTKLIDYIRYKKAVKK